MMLWDLRFREAEIFEMVAKHLEVRYIYEDEQEQQEQEIQRNDDHVLDPEALAALPLAMLTDLEYAVICINLEAITEQIDRIRPYDEILADTLAYYVEQFDYQHILTAIQHAGARQ